MPKEKLEASYLAAALKFESLTTGSVRVKSTDNSIVEGTFSLRDVPPKALSDMSLQQRRVTLAPFKDQPPSTQQNWLSDDEGGPPLSAETHQAIDWEHEQDALLPPYWHRDMNFRAKRTMLEDHVKEQLRDTLPADLRSIEAITMIHNGVSQMSDVTEREISKNIVADLDYAYLDTSNGYTQLLGKHKKSITEHHQTTNELLHRGMIPPMHAADVKTLIPYIESLVFTDPQLFKDIVSSLDLLTLLRFTRLRADPCLGTPGLQGVTGLMFLLQAIQMRSAPALEFALWEGREQIHLTHLHLIIAKYFATRERYDTAINQINALLEHRRKSSTHWNPKLPSPADLRYL